MPAAIETRTANGMETPWFDVWETLRPQADLPPYDMLIASPPCQTFSIAGSGTGRKALDEVLLAVNEGVWDDPGDLRAFGEQHDPRTALVLAPLTHIVRDEPAIVVLEQVPTVLPVWQAYAELLRHFGYSVVTEILRAEQYGVPQTRKRAILIARRDAEARMPVPTHSRFYERDPKRLDIGVEKWVSMAKALGWGMTARPYPTIAGARETGGPDKEKVGGSHARATIYAERDAGRWVPEPGQEWALNRPATTVVGSFQPDVISAPGYRTVGGYSRQDAPGSIRVTLEQVACLQSYPDDFQWRGTKTAKFQQVGNAVPPLFGRRILEAATA
jgi:DNA (cytosine-5)-methyltransferase 1